MFEHNGGAHGVIGINLFNGAVGAGLHLSAKISCYIHAVMGAPVFQRGIIDQRVHRKSSDNISVYRFRHGSYRGGRRFLGSRLRHGFCGRCGNGFGLRDFRQDRLNGDFGGDFHWFGIGRLRISRGCGDDLGSLGSFGDSYRLDDLCHLRGWAGCICAENVEYARIHIKAYNTDSLLSILPLAHIFGQVFDFLFPISSGSHVNIFTEKPIPVRLLKAIAEVKPFMFLTVPLIIEKIFKSKVFPVTRKLPAKLLLKIPGLDRIVLNKIRKSLLNAFGNGFTTGVILGGAALNREVEDLLKRMKFPYVVGYGMTECGPLISYRDKSEYVKYSCGADAGTVDIRIDSSNPHRVLGEIQVKGDAVMLGYYKNEDATAATFTKDGWLKTGDMGLLDKKGNLFIKGRCKNMILTASGQNIYPEEIEDKINNLPYVVESLVVGRKNALVALVVADYEAGKKAGLDEKALDKLIDENVLALNDELAAYSKIGYTEIRRDAFEKTPKQSIRRFLYS